MVLQKLMPSGWYFPARYTEYINLLIRAVRQCEDYTVREIGFGVRGSADCSVFEQ